MIINSNNYVLEIINMLEPRELAVNSDYQRGSGLWPDGPSSYFIDTILEGFPFPKIYMYEYLDRPNRRRGTLSALCGIDVPESPQTCTRSDGTL